MKDRIDKLADRLVKTLENVGKGVPDPVEVESISDEDIEALADRIKDIRARTEGVR